MPRTMFWIKRGALTWLIKVASTREVSMRANAIGTDRSTNPKREMRNKASIRHLPVES